MLRAVFQLFLIIAFGLTGAGAAAADTAGADQRAALEQLYEDYRQAWLRNDAGTEEAVLALFSTESAIIPSGGRRAFVGTEEMRAFWFDGPPGYVDLFEQTPLKVSAGEDHGFVLGRFKLRFSYPGESYYTEGFNLFSAVKENGTWRISTMMWTHPPWEVKKVAQ